MSDHSPTGQTPLEETAAPADAGTPSLSGGGGSGTDLVGTVLAGRYRILSKLGEGAMGAVYLGEHLKIGRRDAIKTLRESLAVDPEAVARFTRGTRNVAAIDHPNVCRIYDYSDTADGLQFLAMEFVPGPTLKELLEREGSLPVHRALQIARQVAAALQAAHELGIVHRDLKPANIMIARGRDHADLVKVVDFDLAKGAQDSEGPEVTRFGFVVGTPEYMSPEQLLGERLDGRSDVYSLGIVLFRMLTGSLPFRAATMQDLMVQRLTQKPLQLEQVLPEAQFPAQLQQILDRALERRPSDRYASAAELEAGISEVLAGLPFEAGEAARSPQPQRRHMEEVPETRVSRQALFAARRKLAGAVAALSLAVVLGMGWFLTRSTEGSDPPDLLPIVVSTPVHTGKTESADTLASTPLPPVETPTPTPPVAQPRPAPEITPPSHDPAPPPPPRESGIRIALHEVGAILMRQFDRVGPPHPARAALHAIRDTTHAIWNDRNVPRDERAFAAYILGSAWLALREPAECVRWVQEALLLQPEDQAYRDMREGCERQIR